MNRKEIEIKLAAPFSANDIEWRIQSAGIDKNGNPWGMVMPYITSRAVMQRLDDTLGLSGWTNTFSQAPEGGVLCGLSLRIGKKDKRWITKYDAASNTEIESVKGGISDSMKRAAVQVGIGRYLYKLPIEWAICSANNREYEHRQKFANKNTPADKVIWGSWKTPILPDSALPNQASAPPIETITKTEEKALKELINEADSDTATILKACKVTRLSEIHKSSLAKVIDKLEKKIEDQAEDASDIPEQN